MKINKFSEINNFRTETKFNRIYSRKNLPELKDGANVINLLGNDNKQTYWISLLIDKIQLCTLILFELNIFRRNIKQNQRQINQSQHIKHTVCCSRMFDCWKEFVRLYNFFFS